MLHLRKIKKLTYNPLGKNQENEDRRPVNYGDRKISKNRGMHLHRGF